MFRPSWILLHIFVFVLCIFWRPTMFRPVWRLPLQGGYIHAWGDKYTYAHSLWWEYIICSYFVSDPHLNIIQIFTIHHLWCKIFTKYYKIFTKNVSDPGVGPALEYSSLPSIVNLSCSVRQVNTTKNDQGRWSRMFSTGFPWAPFKSLLV